MPGRTAFDFIRPGILPVAAYRVITIFHPSYVRHRGVGFYGSLVAAGFPSPADDHLDRDLDLVEYLVANKRSTFYVRVKGESMRGCGIFDNALLVVDRSLRPRDGDVVLAVLDGEFTCKRLRMEAGRAWLRAENPDFADLPIPEGGDFRIWGVVTSAINDFRRNR